MRVYVFFSVLTFLFVLANSAQLTAAENDIYIKIQDLVPEGDSNFTGADIDAVELASPDGMVRMYAYMVQENDTPYIGPDHASEADAVLGAPVLISSGGAYVKSLNGGSLTVAINTLGLDVNSNWKVSVYEVDGTLYAEGAPEPYQIYFANNANGPWTDLGIGSGISSFKLEGNQQLQLTDIESEKIAQIVATVDESTRLPESLASIVAAEEFRIHLSNSAEQMIAEMKAFLVYYGNREHMVMEHGDHDDGGLQATARIIAQLNERYTQLRP